MTAGLRFDCRLRHADGFTLEVAFVAPPGTTAIVGPSGSGKSTILALIAGLRRPDRGVVAQGERVLVDVAARRWTPPERRGVGFVPQESLLFPHRSVAANLRYGAARGGVAFDRVVERLELGDLLDRAPVTLSGGQARRVAIGRAVLAASRMLLLDEPWAGLDAERREAAARLVRETAAERPMPVLLVGHDPGSITEVADHVVAIADGRRADPEPAAT